MSPLAFCSAGGHQKRLWGTGILLLQDFCGKTMQAVTGQPIKKIISFRILHSLMATNSWSKNLRTLGTRLSLLCRGAMGCSMYIRWRSAGTKAERVNGLRPPPSTDFTPALTFPSGFSHAESP